MDMISSALHYNAHHYDRFSNNNVSDVTIEISYFVFMSYDDILLIAAIKYHIVLPFWL